MGLRTTNFEFVSKKKTIKKLLFQYKKRFLSMNI